MMRTTLLCVSAIVLSWGGSPAQAAALSPQQLDLPKLRYGAMAWAVPDTSSTIAGKSVLAMTGLDTDGKLRTYIFHIEPDPGGQPEVVKRDSTESLGIPGVVFGQLDWADYDRDGLLDLAIAGRSGNVVDTAYDTRTIALVYRQRTDGSFAIPSGFPTQFGMDSCVIRWVDYDVDGFVDLFISGRVRSFSTVGGKAVTRGESGLHVLRNGSPDGTRHEFVLDDGVTSRVDQIVPVYGGDADWADMNGDGTPDLAICGLNISMLQGGQVTKDTLTDVYINDPPGVLTRNVITTITPRYGGGIAWEDFNQDGRLDLAISGRARGSDGGAIQLEVWKNLGVGKFRKEQIGLDQKYALRGRLQWGDVNNDGWLDIVSLGDSTSGAGGIIYYLNDYSASQRFVPLTLTSPAPALRDGSFALGHLDEDGTLDLIASGYNTATGTTEAYAWTMAEMPRNDPPSTSALDFPFVTGDKVLFTWSEASDLTGGGQVADENMLTYELAMFFGTSDVRVFTAPARYGRGAQGRGLTFALNRSLAPHPGMPLLVRAVDPSGVTSRWSQPRLVLVQDFVGSEEIVVPLRSAGATWVDVDNTGSPDLVVNGFDQGNNETDRLYLNARGKLEPNTTYSLPGFYLGSQAWGDVDGDGLIDVLLTGSQSAQQRITKLFLNESNVTPGKFKAGSYLFEELTGSGAAMGDIDNDGDMDFVVTGLSGVTLKTFVALNTGVLRGGAATFDTTSLNLPLMSGTTGLKDGWITLCDYDQDGLLDLTIQGTVDFGNNGKSGDDYLGGYLEIYRNEGNLKFTRAYGWPRDRAVPVPSIAVGDTALDQLAVGEHVWADIDNDGDPDFIAVGYSRVCTEFTRVSHDWDASALRIYENLGGGHLVMRRGYAGLWNASLAVADLDNDGYVDILLTGNDDHDPNSTHPQGDPKVRFYRNAGNHTGEFTLQNIMLFNERKGAGIGAVRLADLDGDGDLDAVVIGESITPGGKLIPTSAVYTNTNSSQLGNRRSSPPTVLTAHQDTTSNVRLTWDEAFDPDGRQDAHTYSLRIGTMPGRNDVRPGVEQVGPGSLGYRRSATIRNLPDGRYYWSAQAVDHAWLRSEWAPEQSFIIDTAPPRVVRVRGATGDSLSVGPDEIINVAIALYDSLTGVNEASPDMSVTLSILGSAPVAVVPNPQGWQQGSVWVGQAIVPAGTFLSEPVTVHISGVRDVRGNLMPDASIRTRLVSSVFTRVTPERGGHLTNSASTVTLFVPPRAVTQDVRLSLVEPDQAVLPVGPGPAVGVVVELEPDASTSVPSLRVPAILTMSYAASAKVAQTAQVSGVHVFRLDGTTWDYVGGSADEAIHSISVAIKEFGVYGLFLASREVTEARLDTVHCTPRVLSPRTSQGFSDHTEINFRVATGDVGSDAWIRIYNDAGRLIRNLSPQLVAGVNTVPWDGLDEGGNLVPSGLYIVVVRIGEIQKTKTVVVLNKYAGS